MFTTAIGISVLSTLSIVWADNAHGAIAVAEIKREKDIIYGRKHGMALTMDAFRPAESNGLGVIWIVSRGGRSDHDWLDAPELTTQFDPLLARGYTVFAVVHGSAPRFDLQDFLADARRAVRFVRHHAKDYGIDPMRLGVGGASAGGNLALLLGTTGDQGIADARDPVEREASKVQAVGCFFAPSDWVNFERDDESIVDLLAKSGRQEPSFIFQEFDKTKGVYLTITEKKRVVELLREHSPVSHVSKDDAPTLIIHGDADRIVPFQQGRRMIDQLTKVGVKAKLVVREGKGHAWGGWRNDITLVADWFDQFLKNRQ
jgi:acetyl esterase/lipase